MAIRQEIYRITFLNKGKVYEIFARQVYQSELYGFIEVEEFLFDERSQMLVDPSEEKLKMEFQDVKRSFIPLQAILRIDEVEKTGVAKISSGDNIMPFPLPAFGTRDSGTTRCGILPRLRAACFYDSHSVSIQTLCCITECVSTEFQMFP